MSLKSLDIVLIRSINLCRSVQIWLRKDSHATKNSSGKERNVTYIAEFGLDFAVKFAKVSEYLTGLDSSYWSFPLSSKKGKEEG